MRRVFGDSNKSMKEYYHSKKKEKPSLDDATERMDKRVDNIDQKIAKLDAELVKYKKQMAGMRNGAAKSSVKQRAMKVLKQKRMYEQQRETMYSQQFNMDQTKFTIDGMRDVQTTVGAMKIANKELKKGMKKIDLDEVEDLRDEMEDLMEDSREINEIMGGAFGVPDDVDEYELEAELEGLEDEAFMDGSPSYLEDAPEVPSKGVSAPNEQDELNEVMY